MKAIERLEKLLDEQEEKISELNKKIETLERDQAWTAHQEGDQSDNLPVPRLEMRAVQIEEWYQYAWEYSLVYRHLLGDIIAVPMGRSTSSGGANYAPDTFQGVYDPNCSGPFRDGVHIWNDSKCLNLPAFLIVEDRISVYATDEQKGHIKMIPWQRVEQKEEV